MIVKKLLKIFLIILIVYQPFTVTGNRPQKLGLHTVVIDPGHGGKDYGAVGREAKEKDIVLAIALKVGEYLRSGIPGLNVVFTRTTDTFVPLARRAEIANRAEAGLFVSIHTNAVSNPRVYGTETFVLGLHRSQENLEVAKRENSVITLEQDYTITYEGFDPNSPESYIIFELMQNAYLDQSITAASFVQDQFENRVGRTNRGVKQAGFLVLRKTAMPGILVEVGFISNPKEERFIASEEGQVYLASAIFRAIRDYKEHVEARSNIAAPARASSNTLDSPAIGSTSSSVIDPDASDEVIFRVQLASVSRKIPANTGLYTMFDDIWMYQEDNLFKYTTGVTKSYQEIERLLAKVRKIAPNSFIVAFRNGQRVPVSSVRVNR